MIFILHGDNQTASRDQLNQNISQYADSHQIQRLDAKEVSLEKINMFLNSTSLFADKKVLVLTNYFSVTKAIFDKVNKLISSTPHIVIIWQDKLLNITQLKTFPQAKATEFTLPKTLFLCLNSIKPANATRCIPLLQTMLKTEPYELFLYLLKGNFRKQLATSSPFDKARLKKSYLSLIELEFQTKTGTLSIPKEIALERILVGLMR